MQGAFLRKAVSSSLHNSQATTISPTATSHFFSGLAKPGSRQSMYTSLLLTLPLVDDIPSSACFLSCISFLKKLHLLFKGVIFGQITRMEKGEERPGCSSPFSVTLVSACSTLFSWFTGHTMSSDVNCELSLHKNQTRFSTEINTTCSLHSIPENFFPPADCTVLKKTLLL